ncbi:MAG: S8 family serine peptidase, partial [Siculibacillus sp.]|nr:S8 family serine peptidase [Siculibacillus sp.]
STHHVVACLDWSVTNGARVVSMSFAGPADTLLARSLAAMRQKGVIAVAAAGNAGPQSPPLFPAADPAVIAVTASDPDDRILPVAVRGGHLAVTAPGVDIVVASPKGGYDVTSGTSVAAAEVAGVVALLLEKREDLSPDEARRILSTTAIDLGPKGRDPIFGAGLVDADAAVAAVGGRAR